MQPFLTVKTETEFGTVRACILPPLYLTWARQEADRRRYTAICEQLVTEAHGDVHLAMEILSGRMVDLKLAKRDETDWQQYHEAVA